MEKKRLGPSWVIQMTTATVFFLFFVSLFLSSGLQSVGYRAKRWYVGNGEFFQRQWGHFLDIVGDDAEKLYFYGTLFAVIVVYWSFGGLYTLMDFFNKPEALRRYKIQPGTNEPLKTKDLLKVIGLVLFNQTVMTLPTSYLGAKLITWLVQPNVRELPSLPTALFQLIGCVLVEEAGFYYSHRLLHHKKLYKFIHKKHHEWTAPISIVAIYAHPIEHVLSNLMPPLLGVLIFRCHVVTAWLWFSLAIAFTLSEHSGYHLPFFPSPEAHDYHHVKFNQCFGVLGILDSIHGTNKQFKAALNGKRHKVLTSLQSMHELYPEKPGKKAE